MILNSTVLAIAFAIPQLNATHAETPLGTCLKAQGYVGVPMERGKWSGWYYLQVKINDVPTRFIIDTGAAHTCLTKSLATRLGYKLPEPKSRIGPFGQTIHEYGKAIPLIEVAGLQFGSGNLYINDLLREQDIAADQVNSPAQGLLGSPFLSYFNAVIDYQSDTLYLLDPAIAAKPLQGEWILTAAESNGMASLIRSDCRLVVKGGVAELGTSQSTTTYLLQPRTGGQHRRLDLLMPSNGSKPMIYKLEAGILTIAGQLRDDDSPFAERPKSFKTTPKSRYAVLTFEKAPKVPDRIPFIEDSPTIQSITMISASGKSKTIIAKPGQTIQGDPDTVTTVITYTDGSTVASTIKPDGSVEIQYGMTEFTPSSTKD